MTIARRLAVGAGAGLIATVPMTLALKGMRRLLPADEQYALPPREIVEKVTTDMGLQDDLSDREDQALTVLSHYGYGAAAGAAYAALAPTNAPRAAASGLAFGLLLWAWSYLVWLPALHILRPATEHPLRRTAMMIASHLIWGLTLGLLLGSTPKKK